MSEWVEAENRPFGWFGDVEGEAYEKIVAKRPNGLVVECGAYLGRSVSYILPTCRKLGIIVYCVDLWNWTKSSDPKITCPPCSLDLLWANLKRMGYDNYLRMIVMDSVKAAELFQNESINVVMIDTTHRCDDTLREIDAWWPRLYEGGAMLFHDYGRTSSSWRGEGDSYTFVKEAVDQRFGQLDSLHESLAVVVKK